MEFGKTEFDWDLDSQEFWDFSPQSLKLLEDSLIAEVFGCEDTSEHFQHNHIHDEHDYFKKTFLEEDMTEQNDCLSLKGLTKPKKKLTQNKISSKHQVPLLRSNCDDDISHLSISEKKSFKKCLRKMKNRVRIEIMHLIFPTDF